MEKNDLNDAIGTLLAAPLTDLLHIKVVQIALTRARGGKPVSFKSAWLGLWAAKIVASEITSGVMLSIQRRKEFKESAKVIADHLQKRIDKREARQKAAEALGTKRVFLG